VPSPAVIAAHKYRGRQKLLALALATPWGDVSAISTSSLTTATTEEKHNTPFPTTRGRGGGGCLFPEFFEVKFPAIFSNFKNRAVEQSSTPRFISSLDGILGHQFNKRLVTFAPCYSQFLEDLKENHTLLWF
jgi:hypothetical protein